MNIALAPAPTSGEGKFRRSRAAVARDVFLGPVSALLVVMMLWRILRGPDPAFDYQFAYWNAGHRVLHGASPYLWTAAQYRGSMAFVYPALSALSFAPAALLPRGFGAVTFTFVCVALVPTTLWITRVRDWRVYGIALIWLPVYGAWMTANESLFLMFALACLWRWRDKPAVAGILTAAAISLKPLMWPLALWLLATRRWTASGWALASGILLNLAAWSVLGFGQIAAYLHAVSVDTDDSWRTGFGVPALLAHLGGSLAAGTVVMLILSASLAAAVVYIGFVKHDQIRALALTVALALVSSPLLWTHYLVLLIVPLAVLRPRLSWVWALPLLMWVSQPADPVHVWQAVVVWSAAIAMFAELVGQRARDITIGV